MVASLIDVTLHACLYITDVMNLANVRTQTNRRHISSPSSLYA